MRILLIGSTGMLGSDCREVLSEDYEIIAPDKKELDIVSWDLVIETLQAVHPDVVLNCAGFSDVDACEEDLFTVKKVNVEGPRNLAQGSARYNCKLVHISTDYVFNGKKNVPQPYFEDDTTDPLSAYGKSKMDSEIGVRENAPNYIIIRTSWLFGRNGKNFIHTILTNTLGKRRRILKAVDDQYGSPTWTYRVALQIKELLRHDAKGTFHASAEGYCTWFDYAKTVFKKLKRKVTVEPCSLADYPHAAERPVNCILENRLLKKQGLNIMREWDEDVGFYLDKYGQELIKLARAGKLS
jgi:dTDP-4-dehydrorhamnose reductase